MTVPANSFASSASAPDVAAPYDRDELFFQLDGYTEILSPMLAAFRVNAAEALAEIHRALDGGDAGGLATAAHSMKGAVSCFRAAPALAAAACLEEHARNRDLAASATAVARLDAELARLLPALERLELEVSP